MDVEIALGVAGDFGGAELLGFAVHDFARMLGGGDEVDLILLDDPATEEAGVVGLQVGGGGEGLDLAQEVGLDAFGRGDEFVVEEMFERTGGGFPTGFLDLARLAPAFGVGEGFRLVVVIAGVGGPVGVDLGVEGPIRKVNAVDGVGEGAGFEFVRGKPTVAIPFADFVADFRLGDLKFEQRFRADGCFDLIVRNERRGAAKVAPLGHARRIEDGDRLAALAFH